MNTFVCVVSLYVAETPKTSTKDHEPPVPIMPFGIVAYGFVGQPFSKQLYIKYKDLFCFTLPSATCNLYNTATTNYYISDHWFF